MQIFTYYFIEKNTYIVILKLDFYWINKHIMKKLLIFSMLFSTFAVLNYCSADTYTQELKDAYNWAYSKSITTQPTIDSANMKGKITREEMAKMITNYAINIL